MQFNPSSALLRHLQKLRNIYITLQSVLKLQTKIFLLSLGIQESFPSPIPNFILGSTLISFALFRVQRRIQQTQTPYSRVLTGKMVQTCAPHCYVNKKLNTSTSSLYEDSESTQCDWHHKTTSKHLSKALLASVENVFEIQPYHDSRRQMRELTVELLNHHHLGAQYLSCFVCTRGGSPLSKLRAT